MASLRCGPFGRRADIGDGARGGRSCKSHGEIGTGLRAILLIAPLTARCETAWYTAIRAAHVFPPPDTFSNFRRNGPLLYAALLSSLLFGAGHFDQADTLMASLLNSTITFAGGVMFCWLVERWNSIWPGFVIHAGLNVVWTLYTLGDNAVGGATGNLARLAAIVVAIAGTLMLTRRPAPG